jgi:hypothetical protein
MKGKKQNNNTKEGNMELNNTSNRIADISLKNSAIIAGIGLVLMAILAPIANFAILQKLIVPNDIARTVSNIVSSEGLFRIEICCFLIVAILDIIVAWALYVFLKPVNKSISLLSAWFRIVYATILAVMLIYLLNVLQLLHGAEYLASFTTSQIQAQVMMSLNSFNLGWGFGLIIFGFHLLLLGYLLLKAGYMRKILGILLILASLGYLIDGFGKLLSADYNMNISMFTFIGEIILIFWLLIKGWKIKEMN